MGLRGFANCNVASDGPADGSCTTFTCSAATSGGRARVRAEPGAAAVELLGLPPAAALLLLAARLPPLLHPRLPLSTLCDAACCEHAAMLLGSAVTPTPPTPPPPPLLLLLCWRPCSGCSCVHVTPRRPDAPLLLGKGCTPVSGSASGPAGPSAAAGPGLCAV
jgi:hypothetical protein